MTDKQKKRKDLADEIEIDEKNLGKFHQDGTKEKVSISTYRGKPKNITNDFNFLLDLYEWEMVM
jgi:DNA-binding Xre family transcriptional regulator